MTRLFDTLDEVEAHNARVHQQRRERLGESVEVPALLEKDLQGPILKALLGHSKVALAWRANAGKFKLADMYGERWITVNFKGCSDLLGMLKNGKFLAVEVKADGKNPNADQDAFLRSVNANGGLGFVAHSVDEANAALEAA